MKPRAKWLNDILLGTKPGRHRDKRKKQTERLTTDEVKAVKQYKLRKKQYADRDDDLE